MTSTIIWTIAVVTVLGLVLALVLYLVAQKFKVEEDPRIDEVEKVMPGANCGGCGFAGCRAFAEAAVKAPNLDNNYCPVGGNDTMAKVAAILGYEVKAKAPMVAVVRCNGTCEARPRVNDYDGVSSCMVKSTLYSGDTGCAFGCLGCGDCVNACQFGALSMDPVTGLPVVDEEKCTACGASSGGGRGEVHRLRRLRQGLPQAHPRTAPEGTPRHARVFLLREQGQRPGGKEGLRKRLHRMRHLRQDLHP